ncbi:DNA-binding protein [Ramlibacter terrae]|uniref:DNA-binding protein n=1 Tax=Ramlibacter terrae TaxID=2732511 RepID=A0ABX6P2L3_9BURK|nr:DNA-binding protein [Ramlibacter terrae]
MTAVTFPPISEEAREVIPNAHLAYLVGREASTTRDLWARQGKGPIKPVYIGGRVHWKTSDVRKLPGVEVAQ